MSADNHTQLANFIWSLCNLLRGPYKRNEYRKVILPLTVLRRFDCLLAPTKARGLAEHPKIETKPETVVRSLLEKIAGRPFYNLSKLDLPKLLDDPNQLAPNLNAYLNGFSRNVREIMERFAFDQQIPHLAKKNLLYEVIKKFAAVDLSPERVDNTQMGYIFEELIRIGAEQANEEAGEHFTPREVIKLMVNLLLSPEQDLRRSHVVKTIYDPACGTGGMLSVAERYPRPQRRRRSPSLRSGLERRVLGDLQGRHADQGRRRRPYRPRRQLHPGRLRPRRRRQETHFRPHAGEPPVRRGVETAAEAHRTGSRGARLQRPVRRRTAAYQRRLAAFPATHAREDARAQDGGSRIGIVFNGSPLFTGNAGSGESNIRQWIIENDWLEAVVVLPDQLFYNTGVSTYL